MQRVIEYGSPVGTFPIQGLRLTNRQAYALIALANTPSYVASLSCPPGSDVTEWPALQAGLNAVREALVLEGWDAA